MRTAGVSLLLIGAAMTITSAQPATLDEVLARAASYVSAYQKRLQGIVAEETYVQNVITNIGGRPAATTRARLTRDGRRLRSDVLLVKLGEDDWWLQFRDVFEVDRRPVRDRDERLIKLFIEGKADARAMAEKIQAESARYNIGPVTRTINIPIMALLFLERGNQPRVRFEQGDAGNVKRYADLVDDAARVWLIEFKETSKGTMVKGENNRDVPSHGRLWIDSVTGRVLRTEMIAEDTDLRAIIDVSYRSEPGLDMLVPGEMREIYNVRRSDARIDGRATYTNFRQFSVSTTEKTKP